MIPAALALLVADPPPPVWQGVWAGTIGALPVRACLSRRADELAVGSYFYLRTLRTIPLSQQGSSRVWTEGDDDKGPRWTFAAVSASALAGSWSDGRRTFPFRLSRVPGDDEGTPCGSDLFSAPRWRPLAVTRAARVQDGVRYVQLTYHAGPAFPDVALDGFALPGDDPATRRINADLRKQVPGPDADWHACITGGLDMHGVDGDYRASLQPTLITARWLAADLQTEEDCGGVHPNNNTTPLAWDRRTGAAVDLAGWLNDAALQRHGADRTPPFAVTPAFRRVLIRAADPDTDCREGLAGADFWDVGLARTGLTFQPELGHADQACAEATPVPWATLRPYLSAAGRAALGR